MQFKRPEFRLTLPRAKIFFLAEFSGGNMAATDHCERVCCGKIMYMTSWQISLVAIYCTPTAPKFVRERTLHAEHYTLAYVYEVLPQNNAGFAFVYFTLHGYTVYFTLHGSAWRPRGSKCKYKYLFSVFETLQHMSCVATSRVA